jgi:hypothetical protein
MSKIDNKVERYIILSKQFEKSSYDLFGADTNSNYLISTCTSVILPTGSAQIGTIPLPTEKSRAEKILEKAQTDAKFAEDYEEYKTLQKELGEYFKALNKLT